MRVVGLNMSARDCSAALVDGGRVLYAVREERLNREKKTRKFPMLALGACLEAANASIQDLDTVAISWNPAINLERFNSAQSSVSRYKPEHFFGVPAHLMLLVGDRESTMSHQRIEFRSGKPLDITYVNHHLAHASDSFLQSPFEEAAILVVDAYGEKDSVTFARGSGSRITPLATIQFPHSLGSFYGTLTQFLGFTPDSDEWKVMGASPYGDASRYADALRSVMRLGPEGGFELDLSYFHFPLFSRPNMYSDKLVALLGEPRDPRAELVQRDFDLSAAIQLVAEEVVFHFLRHLHTLTGGDELCLTGGVAMNCVINAKVPHHTPFRRVYVGSSADDGGTSVGAALYAASLAPGFRREAARHSYLGPEYSDEQIAAELGKYGLPRTQVPSPSAEAARRLSEGQIVGWFQGRAEFGERALGNRSILADPRDEAMKDRVNSAIKYRESFRPFAPSILADAVGEYFEHPEPVPFMEKALVIRAEKRAEIPAVAHVDGTGRLQTVERDVNPRYYDLISEFRARTGVPVVMNTSFNLQGEPIVTSPKDAIRTFFSSGLDALIMGTYVIEKSERAT